MSKSQESGKAWLKDNDPFRKFKARRFRAKMADKTDRIDENTIGLDGESVNEKRNAERLVPDGRRLKAPPLGLAFLARSRKHRGEACLLMPFAVAGQRATVWHRGRSAPASRVMCIIAHGEPPTPEHVARHLCGNGHLSCVNPMHLAWGTPDQNVADDAAHRGLRAERPIVRVNAAKHCGGGP